MQTANVSHNWSSSAGKVKKVLEVSTSSWPSYSCCSGYNLCQNVSSDFNFIGEKIIKLYKNKPYPNQKKNIINLNLHRISTIA